MLFGVAQPPFRMLAPEAPEARGGRRAEFLKTSQEPDCLLKLLGNESVQREKVVIYYHY